MLVFLTLSPFIIFLNFVASNYALRIETTFLPPECEDPNTRRSKDSDVLSVHYSGFIDESSLTGVKGKEFDTSLKRGKPFEFTLGAGEVIKGWDE
eukprot:gene62888-86012_t